MIPLIESEGDYAKTTKSRLQVLAGCCLWMGFGLRSRRVHDSGDAYLDRSSDSPNIVRALPLCGGSGRDSHGIRSSDCHRRTLLANSQESRSPRDGDHDFGLNRDGVFRFRIHFRRTLNRRCRSFRVALRNAIQEVLGIKLRPIGPGVRRSQLVTASAGSHICCAGPPTPTRCNSQKSSRSRRTDTSR